MWQDVQLSNKFLRQTNNNKHCDTITQVQHSLSIFYFIFLVNFVIFFSTTTTHYAQKRRAVAHLQMEG